MRMVAHGQWERNGEAWRAKQMDILAAAAMIVALRCGALMLSGPRLALCPVEGVFATIAFIYDASDEGL
jgi:hypothetical protein